MTIDESNTTFRERWLLIQLERPSLNTKPIGTGIAALQYCKLFLAYDKES
jgi:hypothetical protein